MSEEQEAKVNEKHKRFSGADWYNGEHRDIVVGGAGGIGSWVCLFLSRIGHSLYIFDNDVIDESNMAGQFYRIGQIGVNKAQATMNNIRDFSGSNGGDCAELYDKDSETSPIVFSCFDNMAARKLMFEKWAEQEDRELFVDGRMLAEVGMVYAVEKGNEEAYRTQLFSDNEVIEADCSFKATSHCGALIGSMMVGALNNYISNKNNGAEIRVVPFRTDFELPIFNWTELSGGDCKSAYKREQDALKAEVKQVEEV